MNNENLMKHCNHLQITLSESSSNDIEAIDLRTELILFRGLVEENMTLLYTLKSTKKASSSFPNIVISLRKILMIPVTSSYAERPFSKLKLIKTYLRNSMTKIRLSSLAKLSIKTHIERGI